MAIILECTSIKSCYLTLARAVEEDNTKDVFCVPSTAAARQRFICIFSSEDSPRTSFRILWVAFSTGNSHPLILKSTLFTLSIYPNE